MILNWSLIFIVVLESYVKLVKHFTSRLNFVSNFRLKLFFWENSFEVNLFRYGRQISINIWFCKNWFTNVLSLLISNMKSCHFCRYSERYLFWLFCVTLFLLELRVKSKSSDSTKNIVPNPSPLSVTGNHSNRHK